MYAYVWWHKCSKNLSLTNTHPRANPEWQVRVVVEVAAVLEPVGVEYIRVLEEPRVAMESADGNVDTGAFFDHHVSSGNLKKTIFVKFLLLL